MRAWPERMVLLGVNGYSGRALTARLEGNIGTAIPYTSRSPDLTYSEELRALAWALGADSALVFVFASALAPDRGGRCRKALFARIGSSIRMAVWAVARARATRQ